MKNFISTTLFIALTTLSISVSADTVDMVQMELNELSAKTNSVFKQAQETNNKVRMNNPIDCVDFIENVDDGVRIQFTEGVCLSGDYILNEKIKDQDYFSGGLFHTSCEGLICKRTYRMDDRSFDEIAGAHRVAENYASNPSYRKSIISIANDLYRKSKDKNKEMTLKSHKFFGTEVPCSAKIIAAAKEHTIKVIFPNVCPVPFHSQYKGNLKIRPKDLMDSLSALPRFGYSLFMGASFDCRDLTCVIHI